MAVRSQLFLLFLGAISTPLTLYAGDATAQLSPLAQAVASADWTPTGTAGLITGDFQSVPEQTDSELGLSPTGSPRFGFVSTFQGIAPDPDLGIPSPSPLVLFSDERTGFNQTNGSKITSSTFSAAPGDQLLLYFNYVSTDGLDYRDYAWARLVDATTNATAAWLFLAQSGNAPDGDGTSDYVHDKVLRDQTDPVLANQDQDAILNDGQPVVGMPAGFINVWAPLQEPDGMCWAKDPQTSSCGATGWVKSDWTIPDAGLFYLELGVMNWGDQQFQSALAFDFVGLEAENMLPPVTLYDNAVPEPGLAASIAIGVLALTPTSLRRPRR